MEFMVSIALIFLFSGVTGIAMFEFATAIHFMQEFSWKKVPSQILGRDSFPMSFLACCITAWCSFIIATSNITLGSVILSAGATYEDMIALTFLSHALYKQKIQILIYYASFRTLFLICAYVYVCSLDGSSTKLVSGVAACVASTAMYGYRLIVIRRVFKTERVEHVPFLLAVFSFVLPFTFGFIPALIQRDFAFIPTGVASALGALQLMLSVKFADHKVKTDDRPECEKPSEAPLSHGEPV